MNRFIFLLLPTLILISCTSQPSVEQEMPPPEISFSDAMLDSLGHEIEAQINVGDGTLLDQLFSFEQLFERIAWPEVLSAREKEEALRGYTEATERSGSSFAQNIVSQWYNEGEIRFLGVRHEPDGVKLLYRFSSPVNGLNYISFLVGEVQGAPVFVDLHTSMLGENYSNVLKRTFAQDQSSPIHRLLGTEGETKKLSDAIEQMQLRYKAGEFRDVVDYYASLSESLRHQKILHLIRIRAVSAIEDDELYATAIEEAQSLFPNDPALDLLLIDFYAIRQQYDSVLIAIDQLDKRIKDPYLDYQRGSIALAQKDYDKARAYAQALIRYDSALAEPYLLLISAAMDEKNHSALADGLALMQEAGVDKIAFDNIEQDS
ncbi:MAG: tetratricopeptide repeat protein, partial [Candidatus Kapaibacterium sp.]